MTVWLSLPSGVVLPPPCPPPEGEVLVYVSLFVSVSADVAVVVNELAPVKLFPDSVRVVVVEEASCRLNVRLDPEPPTGWETCPTWSWVLPAVSVSVSVYEPVTSLPDEMAVPMTVVTSVEMSVSDWLVSFSVTVVVKLSYDVPPAEPRMLLPDSDPEVLSTPCSLCDTVRLTGPSPPAPDPATP